MYIMIMSLLNIQPLNCACKTVKMIDFVLYVFCMNFKNFKKLKKFFNDFQKILCVPDQLKIKLEMLMFELEMLEVLQNGTEFFIWPSSNSLLFPSPTIVMVYPHLFLSFSGISV